MSSEATSGAAQGAAQGAAAGAVFGPWGAIIGGVIGGAIGFFGGQAAGQAKEYAKKADQVRRDQQSMQNALQRRDFIRQARVQRAQAIAAGTAEPGVQSSAIAGATGSIDSQLTAGLLYFDSQAAMDNLYQQYRKKAGKAATKADTYGAILDSSASIGRLYGDLSGGVKPQSTTSYGSISTPNSGIVGPRD